MDTIRNEDRVVDFKPVKPNSPEKESPILTMKEIMETDWPEPNWVIPGVLVEGLSGLGGMPKIGKSWLGFQLSRAVSTGGMIFGENVQQGRVLHLSLEDPPRRIQDRAKKQGWPLDIEMDVIPLGNLPRGNSLEFISEAIEADQYGLVVIDTLGRMLKHDRNNYTDVTNALEPLQELAHKMHCGLLFIDHHNKTRGDFTDAILDLGGSIAKGAMLDTGIGLYRTSGSANGKLQVVGRDLADCTTEIIFDSNSCTWQLSNPLQKLTTRQGEIFEAVKKLGLARLTDIAKEAAQDKGNASPRLKSLIKAGLIQTVIAGGATFYQVVRQTNAQQEGAGI